MARMIAIDNGQDIIDSRDVIARIAELESLIDAERISEDNGAQPQLDSNGNTRVETATCGECGQQWNDALITSTTPAPAARCPYEHIHDEIEELKQLQVLENEAAGYASDWQYGATLVRDSYFEEYAQELAEDIGAIQRDASWPNNHIDWEAAADALKQDYTSVNFDNVIYWVR